MQFLQFKVNHEPEKSGLSCLVEVAKHVSFKKNLSIHQNKCLLDVIYQKPSLVT